MERFRQHLEDQLGDWVGPLPDCHAHHGTRAAAFCPRCRRPICADCIYPLPTSLRCRDCRPWLDRWVPTAWIAPLSMVGGILGRRWALQTLAFCAGLAAIVWCFPNVVRPQPPDLPDWLVGSRLNAPFLEQSFRLAEVGRAFSDKGDTRRAQDYFARAESACHRHLSDVGDSPLNPQVWLGIGRLQVQQGNLEQAKATLGDLVEESSVGGVAAYYLGRIAETREQDLGEALRYYEKALANAQQDNDALGKFVSFYAEDREKNQWPYVVASLTDTVTHASAIRDDIEEAIARCRPTDDQPTGEETVEFLGAE